MINRYWTDFEDNSRDWERLQITTNLHGRMHVLW